jgi:hypothetical protein
MVSRAFHASKFTQMLRYRDQTGGVVTRFVHPTMGVMYEVRLIPEVREECPIEAAYLASDHPEEL